MTKRKTQNRQASRACVFGLQGSGKSELAAKIAQDFKNVFVYDPMNQFETLPNTTCYVPQHKEYSKEMKAEVSTVVNYVLNTLKPKPDLFIMDETSLFCPNKRPLPPGIQLLNDVHRHEKIDLMFVARRPAQIHTDLVELAKYIYIFLLSGRNDHMYLRNLNVELGSAVGKLEDFHYCKVDPKRHFEICPPIAMVRGGRGLPDR